MNKAKELIKKLESKVYKGETISLLELKKHLEQQNEVFWEDFERILTVSRKNHTKKERIPLTLRELREWRKEWKNRTSAETNQKKVGQFGTVEEKEEKINQNKKVSAETTSQNEKFLAPNKYRDEIKKIFKQLKSRIQKGEKIFLQPWKYHLIRQNEEYWKEFEKQLRIDGRKGGKLRIPITLENLEEWKKEFQRLEVSPVLTEKKAGESGKSDFRKEENKNNSFHSSPKNLKSEPKKEISSTVKFGKIWGPFIYELRSNRLWYLDKEMKWDRKSPIGGDWFSYAGAGTSINLWLMFQIEWQIVVHVKFSQNGTIYSHKAHFSALKTEKVPFIFGSWSEVYKNSEGKWEKKEDLQAAQKFLQKHGIELKMPDEKESKLNEIKQLISQLSEKDKELVREKLIQLEKKPHGRN